MPLMFRASWAMRPWPSTSFLVVEVPPLVGRLLVQLRNAVAGLTASGRTLPLPCKRTLRPPELLLSLTIVARGLYRLAIRGDEEALESEVDTDRRTISGFTSFRRFSEVAREDHVPLAARPLDGDGLDRPFDRTMQLDLDVPDVLEVQAPIILEPTPVAVGWKLNRSETVFGLEARVARSPSRLNPSKERLECFVESAKRGLSRREVQSREAGRGFAGCLESTRLFAVGNRASLDLVKVASLTQSEVVQTMVLSEHQVQSFSLRAVRKQSVLECLPHGRIVLV